MAFPRSILAGLATALLLPTAVLAQICRNAPPLAGNSVGNVNASASLFDGGNTLGGGATMGSTLFFSAGGAYTRYNEIDGHLNSASGLAGYEITSIHPALSICPTASVSYGWGLQNLGVDFTTMTYMGGLSAGYLVDLEPNVKVIPSVDLALVHDRIKADAGSAGSLTTPDTYGSLLLALGFQVRQRWAIVPSALLPIASDGGSESFGISLVFAFGGA